VGLRDLSRQRARAAGIGDRDARWRPLARQSGQPWRLAFDLDAAARADEAAQ
jgi:hypothetical protein